jgi:predicted ABC-type ATPase
MNSLNHSDLNLPLNKTGMANLYLISGCNGAGKTTASYSVLPDMLGCKEFVNADEIAKGLSPFQPEKVAIESGRIMLNRIKDLTNHNIDFAFETTLSTKSYVQFIRKAQEKGYFVTLVFFWLNSPELAMERVKSRVISGGHNIPEDVICRRYWAGINNLSNLYLPICDYWLIIDNSEPPFQIIAEGFKTEDIDIYNSTIYDQIVKL